MADEYIRRQDAIDAFNRIKNTLKNPETAHYDTLMFYEIEDVLEDVEPADVVPVSAYKQVMWERDIAVEQLKQIGKGLGEVMDDVVPVVFCKDCKFYTSMRPDIKTGICDLNVHHMGDDGFCSEGERRT